MSTLRGMNGFWITHQLVNSRNCVCMVYVHQNWVILAVRLGQCTIPEASGNEKMTEKWPGSISHGGRLIEQANHLLCDGVHSFGLSKLRPNGRPHQFLHWNGWIWVINHRHLRIPPSKVPLQMASPLDTYLLGTARVIWSRHKSTKVGQRPQSASTPWK